MWRGSRTSSSPADGDDDETRKLLVLRTRTALLALARVLRYSTLVATDRRTNPARAALALLLALLALVLPSSLSSRASRCASQTRSHGTDLHYSSDYGSEGPLAARSAAQRLMSPDGETRILTCASLLCRSSSKPFSTSCSSGITPVMKAPKSIVRSASMTAGWSPK